ncbi:MAG: peptide chain release factor N(5)-glutamine methyltransferase [Candidatus Kerfeldbacteria bacterium]|nr:peptide chain release factor N(5)-glutamine methyltransferase [Candidatus Kerfeldbacteria bacterium]
MTIEQALQFGNSELNEHSPSAERDCSVLLQHAVGRYEYFCTAHPEYILSDQEEKLFREHIEQRLTGIPVAYIVEHKEFYGKEFFVNQHVLIPRPETEGLIDMVLEHIQNKKKALRILDVCTGSGCIAVTLKTLLPNANVVATDISKEALVVATLNARRHHVEITELAGNLFEALPSDCQPFDVIVCNPPYVPLNHFQEDIPETQGLKFEPRNALLPHDDSTTGLETIEGILNDAGRYLASDGFFCMEFGDDQASRVLAYARAAFPTRSITISKDLSARDRYLFVE